MKTKEKYRPHIISLLALTIPGEAIISIPYKKANLYSFFGFLISAIFGFFLFLLFSFLIKKVFTLSKKTGFANRLFDVFCVVTAFASILIGLYSVKEFLDFALAVLLPRASRLISVLLIGVCIFCFLNTKNTVLLKFCVLSIIPCFIIIIILFCLLAPSMRLMNISVFTLPKISDIWSSVGNCFFRIFTTALPALIFTFGSTDRNTKINTVMYGFILGTILLGAAFLQSMLILGSGVNSFDFPYLSSVGTLTFGSLFTRLDFFVYFLFFVSVIVKSAVCFHSAKYLLKLKCP